MLPTKIKALNNYSSCESSDNEDAPIKITKEALETKAEIQYSQALQYLAKDQLDKAEEHLIELLQSDIISSINSALDQKDKSQSLLIHLKYCCLTNLGNIFLEKLNYSEALTHYQQALTMDSTDLNLWYRIGLAHTKLFQTDQAISAFLEGIKCNPNHWPTLDKLITLLYATNEHVCCLHYISKSLILDSGYLKGHFLKKIIFEKFPSLVSYFKSYCLDGGLDVECTELIEEQLQHKILSEVDDIRNNDPTLCVKKLSNSNVEQKPTLIAKPLAFKNWEHLGGWLLQIYDNIFENYDHSLIFDPIEFKHDVSNQKSTNSCIIVDEKYIQSNFEKPSFKSSVHTTKRRKSSPTLADQLKLSRRSARNKSNSKVNESTLMKSVWNIIPQYLLVNNDGNDKANISLIKWSDDSMDTMDLFRLYEFSDMLSDGPTENLLKNNISNMERFKPTNYENYFGSNQEKLDLNNFVEVNNRKSISNLLDMFLVTIAHKWSSIWPSNMIQMYICVFKRVWIHTEKQSISYLDLNLDSLDDNKLKTIKDEVVSILAYGEILSDFYFQLKLHQKPLEGSIIGGDFCTLWIGSMDDAISILDLKDVDSKIILIRFLWLRALFHIQDKETGLTCNSLNMMLDLFDNDDFEVVLPNLEYFYQINKTITEKLMATLQRNNLLNTIEKLHQSKEYLSVIDILKETLKPQSRTFIDIPTYPTLSRNYQYRYLLNSFVELKNYHELFKWCESSLYESIIQYRKCLIEDIDLNQKIEQAEFINDIFYAMIEAIQKEGLNVFDNLTQRYKSRIIQSVINLLSYLIESTDANLEINVIHPWLLIYNLLKYEESKTDESTSNNCSILPSLSLLIIGHEFLGKKSWCCFEDGILLFLMLSEIEPYIYNLDLYSQSLVQQVDQIFYCLYTHLIKRNKPRYVQDHNSMGLALTWPRAIQLVRFHCPSELPSYDGLSKAFTINADIEIIFKKVIDLIPEEIKPSRLFDDFMAYIKGETHEVPVNENPLPESVKDIFYLIADYNFKNKTWCKAVRNYLLDLCNNSERFDSWAAMALARGSQIETKLNSCETITNESNIIKKAHMTGRCYKHSLRLSPENTTLLIEYGTFSYSIHSFCSRVLKQQTSNMSIQIFRELESQKETMMKTAKKCFQTANDVWNLTNCESQDERWMHYYILGKIAEKTDDNPILFIDHYLKAIQFLDSYGAKFPDHIVYTTPQHYSIEVLEVYYRIHAGVFKLIEKYDVHSLNEDIYPQIEESLNQLSNMSPIVDANKKTSQILGPDLVNNKYNVIKNNIDLAVNQTLNDLINAVVDCDEKEFYNYSYKVSNENWSYNYNISSQNTNSKLVKDDSNIPVKKIKFSNDSRVQKITNFRWELIQRCIAALEDCIKRFPQHYKSYYRLAHFYFRSPFKDYTKFKDLMFGERGLFAGQRPNNFFHGVWRIPSSEIDRPGSFAFHMNRCIHLLLDFLKETGDHKTLLDLAIQLKYTPDLEKKYLRDNEREDISKEALFLSIQILNKLRFEYAKTNDRSKNELLLIEVYKSYKRVFKCWHQKDNTLSKLLLNVYQNIIGTEENVSNDIIVKYCQKLQAKEKGINQSTSENNVSSPITSSKSICTLDNSLAVSSSCSIDPQKIEKQGNLQQNTCLPPFQNTQEIISILAPTNQSSSSIFPLSLDSRSYSNTLQQKLLATKKKLKQIDNNKKTELKKFYNKVVKVTNNLPNSKPVKNSTDKSIESKMVHPEKFLKSSKEFKSNSLEINNFLNPALVNFNHSVQNLNSPVEIKLLPDKSNNVMSLSTVKSKISDKIKPITIKQGIKTSSVTISKIESSSATKSNIFSQSPKSVCINLDSAAEQARLKSTLLQNNSIENKKTTPVFSTPMLFSSCPGLSITPILNTNSTNTGTKMKNNCNLEHLGNSVTITITDKNKL